MSGVFLRLPILAAALAAGAASADVTPTDLTTRRMVWAHYVPWHSPENDALTPGRYVNHPVSSVGPQPLHDEIRRAKAQGIDGFLMDVCVHPGRTTFSDLRAFLRAAEGQDFFCAVCLDRRTTVSNQIAEVGKMLALNAGHPNYPKALGRPLVATYTWHEWTPEEWRQIRDGLAAAGSPVYLVANLGLGQKPYDRALLERYADVFDAGYYFGYGARGPSVREKNAFAAALCARRGRPFMPSLAPGYFGGWVHGRNDFYTPFRGIDAIQDAYESARGLPGVNWLHLTTWNDYDETALLPCRLTPGCFPLVRAYADAWKGHPPPARADVVFAYHREEFAGTVIRFEAMRLPSADTAPLGIGGRLLDKDGRVVATLATKTLAAAWERAEWLVSSTPLAVSPVLLPEVALEDGAGVRRAALPGVFLVRGWLECPETVRVTAGDCAAVDGALSVTYGGGRLSARLAFSGETPVSRAILYRNDRPLAQFAPDGAGDVQLPLIAQGAGNWRLDVKGGRVAAAQRLFCPARADGRFQVRAASIVSRQTPGWAQTGIRVSGSADLRLVLTGNRVRREVAPAELAAARRIDLGGIVFSPSPDLTLLTRTPWGTASGTAALALFDRTPQPADAFWVRFETVDGRAAATRPIWPFAPKSTVAPAFLVETPVTLESPSHARRAKNATEFRTPRGDWPVRETRLVRTRASVLSVRRARWPMGGRGGDDVCRAGVNAYGERPIDGRRLPLRMWPTGPGTISFDLFPDAAQGVRQVILSRHGWMEGVHEIALTDDGRLAVSYGDHAPALTVTGARPVPAGRWTRVRIVFDGRALRVFQNGRPDGEGALAAPGRCYGNCTVWIGGKSGAQAFRGKLANLELSGDAGADNNP